ncbi:hypothetical protein [Paenibacillus sp. GCM10027626]|uniref:hypothetical protein n=1 Tax=Paenibacillus sp. GCM10027626 TaxID=3273411 RepID=UPI00362FB67F
MAVKLAIFTKEQQAIQAIHELEQKGAAPGEIHVFARDREHSRRIEVETDVHADEMQEFMDTRADSTSLPMIAVMPTGVTSGSVGFVSAGAGYGGLFPGLWTGNDNSAIEDTLQALGLEGTLAAQCQAAIAEGAVVVALGVGDGSADSGAAGAAEGIFRRCGAEQIILQ